MTGREAALLLDRFQGCLVGLAAGDALGGPVEGCTPGEIAARYGRLTEMVGGGWLGLRPGETTDDTAMMLCIARSIVETGRFDPDDVVQHFLGWFRSNPKDIGNITRRALAELERGTPWKRSGFVAHRALGGMSAGNGSIMRCAPIALLHRDNEHLLIRDSIYSSIITHFDQKASWAAAALNLTIARLLSGSKDALLEAIAPKIQDGAVRQALMQAPDLDEVPTSGYVLDTLQAALWSFLRTDSFEDAVATAVNLGGDADTTGAVCGALAGACYGLSAIPGRWLAVLESREEIMALAGRILALAAAKLKQALEAGAGAWTDESHPDLRAPGDVDRFLAQIRDSTSRRTGE